MKARLTAEGCLVVIAETEVECFALKHWYEQYNKDGDKSVTLLIDTTLMVSELAKR